MNIGDIKNLNTNTSQKEKCSWCFKGSSQTKYCPYCGRLTGRVSPPILSQYKNSEPVKMVEIANGGSFFIRFKHEKGFPVNIECDISNAKISYLKISLHILKILLQLPKQLMQVLNLV